MVGRGGRGDCPGAADVEQAWEPAHGCNPTRGKFKEGRQRVFVCVCVCARAVFDECQQSLAMTWGATNYAVFPKGAATQGARLAATPPTAGLLKLQAAILMPANNCKLQGAPPTPSHSLRAQMPYPIHTCPCGIHGLATLAGHEPRPHFRLVLAAAVDAAAVVAALAECAAGAAAAAAAAALIEAMKRAAGAGAAAAAVLVETLGSDEAPAAPAQPARGGACVHAPAGHTRAHAAGAAGGLLPERGLHTLPAERPCGTAKDPPTPSYGCWYGVHRGAVVGACPAVALPAAAAGLRVSGNVGVLREGPRGARRALAAAAVAAVVAADVCDGVPSLPLSSQAEYRCPSPTCAALQRLTPAAVPHSWPPEP
eukprot:1158556-Pelagomonas_calceolata.AAC.9